MIPRQNFDKIGIHMDLITYIPLSPPSNWSAQLDNVMRLCENVTRLKTGDTEFSESCHRDNDQRQKFIIWSAGNLK
jgi:hypothetical protein